MIKRELIDFPAPWAMTRAVGLVEPILGDVPYSMLIGRFPVQGICFVSSFTEVTGAFKMGISGLANPSLYG